MNTSLLSDQEALMALEFRSESGGIPDVHGLDLYAMSSPQQLSGQVQLNAERSACRMHRQVDQNQRGNCPRRPALSFFGILLSPGGAAIKLRVCNRQRIAAAESKIMKSMKKHRTVNDDARARRRAIARWENEGGKVLAETRKLDDSINPRRKKALPR